MALPEDTLLTISYNPSPRRSGHKLLGTTVSIIPSGRGIPPFTPDQYAALDKALKDAGLRHGVEATLFDPKTRPDLAHAQLYLPFSVEISDSARLAKLNEVIGAHLDERGKSYMETLQTNLGQLENGVPGRRAAALAIQPAAQRNASGSSEIGA